MRRVTLSLILTVLASGGCFHGIGPQSIPVDRTAYIEALGDSWREQLLFNIVKIRYDDALTFLDVSSITQAYTLNASVNASNVIGWGAEARTRTTTFGGVGSNATGDATALNIVPSNMLTAGFSSSYQSTPTITYTPIAGEVIKEAIFTRLDPVMIFKSLNAAWQPDFIIPYCFASLNNVKGITNDTNDMSDFVACWKKLNQNKAISITINEVDEVKDAKKDEGENGNPDTKGKNTNVPKLKDKCNLEGLTNNLVEFTSNLVKKQKEEAPTKKEAVFITLDEKKDPVDVKYFKRLLDLDRTAELKKKFAGLDKTQIPLKKKIRESLGLMPKELTSQEKEEISAIGHGEPGETYEVVEGIPPTKGNLDKIYVRSRSVFQILTLLAQFIDVPTSQNNWVWPGQNPMESSIIPHFHILTTPGLVRPNEFAAIKYKGNWFYIPNWDTDTKRVFSGLIVILSMMKSAPSVNPILTIPVR